MRHAPRLRVGNMYRLLAVGILICGERALAGQPQSVCCLPNGACELIAGEDDCIDLNGEFLGMETSCAPDPCEAEVGACCISAGPIDLCLPRTESGCELIGGAYQGDETVCADDCDVPTGACCLDSGICRSNVDLFGCLLASGRYQGNDSVCEVRDR